MKKLLICLLAASMMICGGCAEKSGGESASNGASAVQTEKSGFYGLVSNMKICGHDVSLPCTFSDLGSSFSYAEPLEDKGAGWMFTTLYCDGKDIGNVYTELRSDGDYDKAKIVSLVLNQHSEASVNGLSIGDAEKTIAEKLGKDLVKTDMNIDYGNDEEGFIRILLNSTDNTVMKITVMLPEKDR